MSYFGWTEDDIYYEDTEETLWEDDQYDTVAESDRESQYEDFDWFDEAAYEDEIDFWDWRGTVLLYVLRIFDHNDLRCFLRHKSLCHNDLGLAGRAGLALNPYATTTYDDLRKTSKTLLKMAAFRVESIDFWSI